MRGRVELSEDAQEQLARFPRNVRGRISRAIDDFEAKDDSQWNNIKALQGSIKALQGSEWKGQTAQARRSVQDYFPKIL
jgi:phage-related protein